VIWVLDRVAGYELMTRARAIDMLDGSPILDIEPYQSSIPMEQVRRGWLADAERMTREAGR